MYKVVSTIVSEKQAIIMFIGSQGEVNLVLNKKDEDTVIGSGILAASGNADPKDMASVNSSLVKTWKGRAQAVIRPSGTGNVKLIAESQGLKTGEIVIQVTK